MMKTTSTVALILGLFMLLLVMVAAFLFLFQGRNRLQVQRDVVQMEATALQASLAQANANASVALATRSAVENDLATAVSDTVLLEGQLVASQQEVDDLQAQLASRSAITATTTTTVLQTPEVAILFPADGDIVSVGESVEIVIVAADSQGITAVNLLLNDDPWQEFMANDVPLFTESSAWTPTEAGTYEISLLAVNVKGSSSELVTITVTVQQADTASALSDPNDDLRAQIETAVSDIRGLAPKEPVITTMLTPEELRQRVESDLFEEYTAEDARNETLVLASFDLLPIDFELRAFILDLYSEQIAGFYDPETNEFVVVASDDTFGATEQITYAHEFVHALQDQYYDLDLLDDEELNGDASMALRAFVEGEATFIQSRYMLSGAVDLGELLADSAALETPVLDDAPPFFAESLLFPYLTGNEFVSALYKEGEFDALAYAWANLPQSTEQIIHPDRFLADDFPQEVMLPDFSLGDDWQLADTDVFGEAMLRQYLGQQLNADQVDTAVTGWGGDKYAVYHNPQTDELIMVLRQTWDSEEDSIEFAALYPNYPARLFDTESVIQPNGGECWFSDNDLICLFQDGSETLIVRASTLEQVNDIVSEIETSK